MYYINNDQDGHCLFLPLAGSIIPYCLRPSKENPFVVDFDDKNTIHPNFTFGQLREQNISSQMLLGWSASIDLAEQYQMYLNHDSHSLSDDDVLFHNCTSLWFGPFCRFTFDYVADQSFRMIREAFRDNMISIRKGMKVTCYKHLQCQTYLPCLDWREICDEKKDCFDGSDEKDCWQLEVNECSENEHRCRNGQCIPKEFFHDDPYIADCMDRTDIYSLDFSYCFKIFGFKCAEHTHQLTYLNFPCGDGSYTNGIHKCFNGRNSYLPRDFCSNVTGCAMGLTDQVDTKWCKRHCSNTNCIKDNCPDMYEFSNIPRVLGHVRFMYRKKEIDPHQFALPDYVCYDEERCIDFLPATLRINNLTCRHFNELGLENIDSIDNVERVVLYVKERFRACLVFSNETNYCNYSTMYRCKNSSKCIAKRRLLDQVSDCPFNDDETFNQSCSLEDVQGRFKCLDGDQEKCIIPLHRPAGTERCIFGESISNTRKYLKQNRIYFPWICDGKRDLLPILIDEHNETDETECEYWQCNNTYSRCDEFWLCKNGADEVNCPSSKCSTFNHDCVFPNDTSKVSCLPIIQAGNNITDCLGGTDEQKAISSEPGAIVERQFSRRFRCWNDTKLISSSELCDKKTDCPLNDDEAFCNHIKLTSSVFGFRLTAVGAFFAQLGGSYYRTQRIHFMFNNIADYPMQITTLSSLPSQKNSTTRGQPYETSRVYIPSDYAWQCNREIPIRVRLNGNISKLYCLCPPSYYGDRCQYQNQRVSLTVQIRVSADWHSFFIFFVALVDNERNIESHDYFQYVPSRDCLNKFDIYLLYSTRPKNTSKIYSVQIDAFAHSTLTYRASWIFPLQFPFLPVHRLSVLLRIPSTSVSSTRTCSSKCVHGRCLSYVNDPNATFCHCEHGWTGEQCDSQHYCNCASNSRCISASICLCRVGRFGLHCHLMQTSCHSISCMNGGQCVPFDSRYISFRMPECICPEGYEGDRCEYQQRRTRIEISFHHELPIPTSLFIHFITIEQNQAFYTNSTMKKIRFDQNSLTLYTSVVFNIAFAQMSNNYYLIIIQEKSVIDANISTQINPNYRCQSISEIFNETFANQHLLKRVKYYHISCQQQSELVCFYDDVHFCLCTRHRTAFCFEFEHNMTHDCGGYNYCQNNGHCFQEDLKCPTSPICACSQCYFGSRCQFSTKGSSFSLDNILGYHIHTNNAFHQQPVIIKVAMGLTLLIFVLGCIDSLFSFQTFRRKETREVGCGIYLYTSSIVSLITIIMFTSKFFILLMSQIGWIDNHSFVYVQCLLIDFFLRVLLSTVDWLSACVAIERTWNVIRGMQFRKTRSKHVAKWMILIVILLNCLMYIYDPFYRRLIHDEEEQRAWCVSEYPSAVQTLDRFLNIFQFSIPFCINFVSALIIIINVSRTRSICHKTKPYTQVLREQFREHKHLFISQFILIMLAASRLIISFLSGCMESPRDSWFYLIGYYITFVPSMMTFVVFVLPSKMYKKAFKESITQICH